MTVRGARLGAAIALVAVLLGSAAPIASAAPPPPAQQAELQRILEAVRGQYTAPGAGFTFGDGTDDTTISVGSRDLLPNHPIRSSDKIRVGSDTKMFTASVVLLLADEGRLVLDAPLEQYLPGALRYPVAKVPGDPADYDGRAVTLRQLLQHTGGVPDYGADLLYLLNPVHQVLSPKPEALVRHAVSSGPVFRPGTSWGYSNTGYVLLGMVVEKVTGRSLGTEIAERIAEPLGLRNTFFAERNHKLIPGPHVRGFLSSTAPLDVTWFEPGVWGAAGALVSSADDMNTFLSGLLAGDVLPPARLAEMQATVPYLTGGYGLGIVSVPLSCGTAWGHAGFVAGYNTFGLAMADGKHAFLTINSTYAITLAPPANPVSPYELFELALCA
jgi:D-alanyl-D-alanine carboxypeptidase